jgi:hypothetical protein
VNDFWSAEIEPGRSVLEVGRNAGTNLNRLRELGFHDLTGIEINANAMTSVDVFVDMGRVARIVCMTSSRARPPGTWNRRAI